MTLNSIVKPLLFSFIIASFLTCSNDEPSTSASPVIAFKSIQKFSLASSAGKARRDSVLTTISFSDANGDLGEDTRDTARLQQVFGNQRWGNYEIRAFKLVNNTFQEITAPAATRQFVFLGATPSRLLQEGTLSCNNVFVYTGNDKLTPVKFQIRMRDRSLNESNVVETDTVHVLPGQ